jgi:quinol monooxygenase YgiN
MTIEWIVPVGKARSMTEALHVLMATTRTEPGCVGCSVSADLADKGKIRYSEEWQTEDALRRQFNTDRFRRVIALVENATETPIVEFLLPGGSRGLEYIQGVVGRR